MKVTYGWKTGKIVAGLLLIGSVPPLGAMDATEAAMDAAMAVTNPTQAQDLEKNLGGEREGIRNLCVGIAHHNIAGVYPEFIPTAMAKLENAWNCTASPLALAYLGSVQTMRASLASREGDILAAVADLDEGLKKIDKALALDPNNSTLRFLRIRNGIDVSASSPISRENEIDLDLKMLELELDTMDEESVALYWLSKGQFGMLREEWEAAFESLGNAIAAAPGSNTAKKAEDLLWELEE